MNIMVEGKRVNKSTGCKKKSDAQIVVDRERERLKNIYAGIQVPTLLQAADRMLEERWKKLAGGGERYHAQIMTIADIVSNPRLDEITSAWINDVRQAMNRAGKKPATVNRHLAVIRTILRTARDEWEIIDRIPKVRLERENNERTRVISREEQEQMTTVLRSSRTARKYDSTVADLIDFLCETGLRLNEAIGLTDDNFENGCIRIWPKQTKTKKPRSVPLTDRAKEIIDRRGVPPFKEQVDVWMANRSFKWAKEKIGIDDPEFCLHACRHSFASRLLESGASLYDVKELLGHTNFTTTQRYSHLATSHLSKVMSQLDTQA